MSDVEGLAEVVARHREVLSGFRLRGPAGSGWYCACGEPYMGNEPYDPDAFPLHLARALAARVQAARAEERAKVAQVLDALDRTESNFRLAVQGKPVRDMAETLAENAAARADDAGGEGL